MGWCGMEFNKSHNRSLNITHCNIKNLKLTVYVQALHMFYAPRFSFFTRLKKLQELKRNVRVSRCDFPFRLYHKLRSHCLCFLFLFVKSKSFEKSFAALKRVSDDQDINRETAIYM